MNKQMKDELDKCVDFHGHLCPGLVYGFRVAKEGMRLLDITRARDEEITAICENDSCAVDALQVMLGTTAGKGNLIIHNYGKNVYTVMDRRQQKAFRFSRLHSYRYQGDHPEEFRRLDEAFTAGTLTEKERQRHRMLKVKDLLNQDFNTIFTTEERPFSPPPLAQVVRSVPCALCGEMTMATRLITLKDGRLACLPCSKEKVESC